MMDFEIGNKVMVGGIQDKGTIIGWFFDEGNIWVVQFSNGLTIDCFEQELTKIGS
jgi:hypothetical protein